MTRQIPFFVVDAFTDTPFAGNPAGVFFDDAGDLTAGEMQQLCGEVSLESAFVTPGRDGADYCLRYFTAELEVPLCGHATVAATAALQHRGLAQPGQTVNFRNTVGPLPVTLDTDAEGRTRYTLQQTSQAAPALTPPDALVADIARALGCTTGDITATGLPVSVCSTGTPWLMVPVTSEAAVHAAPASFEAITEISRQNGTFGIYLFTLTPSQTGAPLAVRSRCFCPLPGLPEDPVTGSATGALGVYLSQHNRLTPDAPHFATRQGDPNGRIGTTTAQAHFAPSGDVVRVDVTGRAVVAAEGVFTLQAL